MAMRWIFRGFCRNWSNHLHYLLSRSDFGFKFAEIFIIKKQLPDLVSRRLSDSASRGVSLTLSRRVGF
jgi:hypothetical protein